MAKTGSWFSFLALFLACGLNMTAVVLPMWLYNEPYGAYAKARRWGLLRVVGYETRSHKHTFEAACSTAADLAGSGACTVGACPHFKDRCHAWRMLMFTSYAVAAAVFLATALYALALIVGLRESLKTLKVALTSVGVGVVLEVAAVIVYFISVRTVFAIVNTHGIYPVPMPALCFYLTQVAVLLGLCAFCAKLSSYRSRKREAEFTEDVRRQVREVRSMYGFN